MKQFGTPESFALSKIHGKEPIFKSDRMIAYREEQYQVQLL